MACAHVRPLRDGPDGRNGGMKTSRVRKNTPARNRTAEVFAETVKKAEREATTGTETPARESAVTPAES